MQSDKQPTSDERLDYQTPMFRVEKLTLITLGGVSGGGDSGGADTQELPSFTDDEENWDSEDDWGR